MAQISGQSLLIGQGVPWNHSEIPWVSGDSICNVLFHCLHSG